MCILPIINYHNKSKMSNKKTIGYEVACIMCILSNMYSDNSPSLLAYFFIFNSGRFIYGSDRLIDNETIDSKESLLLSFISINSILFYKDLSIVSPIELTVLMSYSYLKENYPFIKPFYVGFLWSICCLYLPSLMDETSADMDNFVSLNMLTAGISNMADIDDIEDDIMNNIITIPAKIGKKRARLLSGGLFLGSAYLKMHHNTQLYCTGRNARHRSWYNGRKGKFNSIRCDTELTALNII